MKEQAWSAGSRGMGWLFRSIPRPKKAVGESEIVGEPVITGKYPNKTLLHPVGKLPGKTGWSWLLDIFGKQKGERGGFFPTSLVRQMRYQKGSSPTLHRTHCSGQYTHLSRPFQKAQVFSLHFTLFLKWACIPFIIRKKKNNLHFKKLAGASCLQDGNLKTHSLPLT